MQTPRVSLTPKSRATDADDAAFLASSYGLTPDEWQMLVLEGWLSLKADGTYAATRCGLAVPRQNGKNAVLEIVELYKIVVLGRKILHTAHEVKTARKAFIRLTSFFENERKYPELASLVKEIRKTNGQEAITLTNGGSVEFVARSRGSGRGFTVDDLVMDEAQELSEDALAALLPTISSAPSRNPQQIMTGTPPSERMDGAVWTRMRDAGVAGKDRRLAWFEWSCEGDVDLDSRDEWAASNPALGDRLSVSVIIDERAAMDPVTFARERLGMWASEKSLRAIPGDDWDACATDEPPTRGHTVFALDMNPDRSMAAIGVACEGSEAVHVEIATLGPVHSGSQWVIDWLSEPRRRRTPVVVDAMSPAASLVNDLQRAGVTVITTTASDMANACGSFVDAVRAHALTHFDQDELNRAVAGATKRNIGTAGAFGWDRKGTADISALVAVTLAAHGLSKAKRGPARAPRRIY